MQLQKIPHDFSVCKVGSFTPLDLDMETCFIGKTDEEISLICPTDRVPGDATAREDGWRAFRIQGVLDFSLIGILSRILDLLAEHQIGIMAVSTYNTDYVFTKAADFAHALEILRENGYTIV